MNERQCTVCEKLCCRLKMDFSKTFCYFCEIKAKPLQIHYNFATRSRPHKMAAAIATIKAYSHKSDWTIGLVIDDDDRATLDSPQLMDVLQDKRIYVVPGTSKNKIHAINRGMVDWKGDIVVNMSDDMRFIAPGYDIAIINAFGDNLDQFIHFPDGRVNHLLPTMSIMGRTYYERFGYIYHPQYLSLWCDNEAMDVAKKLGKWKYVPERIFDHDHPAWTGEPIDAQLRHTQGYYHIDEQTYIKRSAAGFPNENV
jgi:glycosyltransferase involved in cell wall biosynthesis